MSRYWFKRRRFGWGWIPATWHGWAVLAIFILVGILGAVITLPADKSLSASWQQISSFLLIFVLDLTLFIHIAVHHGPKPHWRWGKSGSDNPDEDF
ncbi:MAG TPA: hypothetical protein VFL81_02540 [Candidatus Saccharimonadales bacterium]|nr:hypothetical protein [Candidatus Saccharimonadales bacterium]